MTKKYISIHFNFKEDYKYPLFLLSLATYMFLPSILGKSDSNLLNNLLFLFLIVSSLTLIRSESKITLIFTYLVGIIGIGFELYHTFVGNLVPQLQAIYRVSFILYFLTLFIELIKQIFSAKEITLNVIMGAFTGYIMIGIFGYFIFRIIFMLNPSAFAISQESTEDLFYFSFITLTTIGYGDITPLTEPARNFALIMGLVGQFYNSIIIAIIIGKFLQR